MLFTRSLGRNYHSLPRFCQRQFQKGSGIVYEMHPWLETKKRRQTWTLVLQAVLQSAFFERKLPTNILAFNFFNVSKTSEIHRLLRNFYPTDWHSRVPQWCKKWKKGPQAIDTGSKQGIAEKVSAEVWLFWCFGMFHFLGVSCIFLMVLPGITFLLHGAVCQKSKTKGFRVIDSGFKPRKSTISSAGVADLGRFWLAFLLHWRLR